MQSVVGIFCLNVGRIAKPLEDHQNRNQTDPHNLRHKSGAIQSLVNIDNNKRKES